MNVRVTIAERFLRQIYAELDNDSGNVLTYPAGERRTESSVEFLVPIPGGLPRHQRSTLPTVRFARLAPGLVGTTHLYWHAYDVPRSSIPRIDIALNDKRGCSAAMLANGKVTPIEEIFIAGARMDRWRPAEKPPELLGTIPADGRFSRYIGALGGDQVHARIRATRAAGIGMARLNSCLASHLARAGVRSLVLIDPDELEAHSLDAVEVLAYGSVGRSKVDAVRDYLAAVAPDVVVRALRSPVNDPEAYAACAGSDLLFSAPDRNHARLTAAICAAAFHRPLVDIGTGISAPEEAFDTGADVRIVVPGDGCLVCIGGVDVVQPEVDNWRRQRAGSLRSLNHMAASYAMLLIERMFQGELAGSRWVRLNVGRNGELEAREIEPERNASCPLCSHIAGLGVHAAELHSP